MTVQALIERLDALLLRAPGVRRGRMFGHPAYYVKGRMFACVYGDVVGLKLPEQAAAALVARGDAQPFQPHGKRRMREWIQLPRRPDLPAKHRRSLQASLDFVGSLPPRARVSGSLRA